MMAFLTAPWKLMNPFSNCAHYFVVAVQLISFYKRNIFRNFQAKSCVFKWCIVQHIISIGSSSNNTFTECGKTFAVRSVCPSFGHFL